MAIDFPYLLSAKKLISHTPERALFSKAVHLFMYSESLHVLFPHSCSTCSSCVCLKSESLRQDAQEDKRTKETSMDFLMHRLYSPPKAQHSK